MAAIRRSGEASKFPPLPLRYRIDPTAKKLDDLDNLERELERENAKGMPPELYFELLGKLQADRAAIVKRRDKGKPPEDIPVNRWDGPRVERPVRQRWSLSKIFWWGVLVFILFRLVAK